MFCSHTSSAYVLSYRSNVQGSTFEYVLKMEMITIKDIRSIMSRILSRSALLEKHPVFHYRITVCSTVSLWLFGVGHGFVRDWGQSRQCLQTQEECQQKLANSKYELYNSLSG